MRASIVVPIVLVIISTIVYFYMSYITSESYLKQEVENLTREYFGKMSAMNSLDSLTLQVEYLQKLNEKTHVIHQKFDLALKKDLILGAVTVDDLVFEWFHCPRTTDTAACELTNQRI